MEKLPIGSRIEWNYQKQPCSLVRILSILVPAILIIWLVSSHDKKKDHAIQEMSFMPLSILEDNFQKEYLPKDINPEIRSYILRFQKTAQEEHKRFGIPASIKLAQGILESRYGTSDLTMKSNNHFGIKCVYRACKHIKCINKCDDSCNDYFVSYPSAWFSFREHSKLLSNPEYRYASLISSCKDDYKCWTKGLQKKGYATSQKYEVKLNAIIQRYGLDKLDSGNLFH